MRRPLTVPTPHDDTDQLRWRRTEPLDLDASRQRAECDTSAWKEAEFGVLVLAFIFVLRYFTLLEGAFGERLFGIPVVSRDDSAITMRQSVVRNLLRVVDGVFNYAAFPATTPHATFPIPITLLPSATRQSFVARNNCPSFCWSGSIGRS